MTIPMNDAVWQDLVDINREVNRKITYRIDAQNHPQLPVPEQWNVLLEGGYGDCDDYAATKRHFLRNRYPQHHDHFRLATCWVDAGRTAGSYHAVLIVETDQGAYVLDNNLRRPILMEDVNYAWHKIEDPRSPTGWSRITL